MTEKPPYAVNSQGNYLVKRKPLSMCISDISAYTSDIPITRPSVSLILSCGQAILQIFAHSQFSDETFIFLPICKIAYTREHVTYKQKGVCAWVSSNSDWLR